MPNFRDVISCKKVTDFDEFRCICGHFETQQKFRKVLNSKKK